MLPCSATRVWKPGSLFIIRGTRNWVARICLVLHPGTAENWCADGGTRWGSPNAWFLMSLVEWCVKSRLKPSYFSQISWKSRKKAHVESLGIFQAAGWREIFRNICFLHLQGTGRWWHEPHRRNKRLACIWSRRSWMAARSLPGTGLQKRSLPSPHFGFEQTDLVAYDGRCACLPSWMLLLKLNDKEPQTFGPQLLCNPWWEDVIIAKRKTRDSIDVSPLRATESSPWVVNNQAPQSVRGKAF